MSVLYVGGDVSKGYVDLCLLPADAEKLPPARRYDDTSAGHAAVRTELEARLAQDPELSLVVGVEATGGLERNWLHFFATGPWRKRSTVYQLNPLAVKRFRERELHGNVTDARSAQWIARYLREGLRRADRPYEPELAGVQAFYRTVVHAIERATAVRNELQALLPVVHPDLVQFCREGFPAWVLTVVNQYPTAPALARARVATLTRIPYVTATRARELIAAGKGSVAALQDAATGAALRALVGELRHLDQQVADGKRELGRLLADDPTVRRLITIPSIGLWTAILLRLELGSFTRFRSAAALISFAGLDPRYHHSGDGSVRLGISKRGRSEVRGALFMNVFSGLRCNPVLQSRYEDLIARGKPGKVAQVACMAKLLRIAYACVTQERDFDPQHAARHALASAPAPAPETRAPASEPAGEGLPDSITAPVSRREAQRRRADARPQAGEPRLARGPDADPRSHDTARPGPKHAEKAAGNT